MAKKENKQRTNSEKGGRANSLANLKGKTFRDKPERINKNGRPPKLIHHITAELKEKGYEPVTESQIIDAYNALLQLPESEVRAIDDDKSKPFFLRLVARWMQSARGMEMLDRIMDRSFGKVLQRQAIDTTIKQEAIPVTSTEDRAKLLADIQAQLRAIDDEKTNETE